MRKSTGEVKKLSSLFEKYKKTLIAPQKTVIHAFVEVVDELLGITVGSEQVKYSPNNKTLVITARGPLKTELQLHKDEIIAHLKGRLGEKNAPQTIL